MIKAANWARTKQIPMLGICLGMQVAVIDAARNLCGYKKATSEEFESDAEQKVVIFMPEGSRTEKGGTMRLVSNPDFEIIIVDSSRDHGQRTFNLIASGASYGHYMEM